MEHRIDSTLCTGESERDGESNTSYLTRSLVTILPELSTLHCYWNANELRTRNVLSRKIKRKELV